MMREYVLYYIISLSVAALAVMNCGNGGSPKGNAVVCQTNRVSLEADDFTLRAGNTTFLADVASVDVSSDPGSDTYCTLEITWQENNVEMRLYVYFDADGTNWWSEEIRTYNAQPEPDWIYYRGEFFKTPLGTAYEGDVELTPDAGSLYEGEITLKGLKLQAFLE